MRNAESNALRLVLVVSAILLIGTAVYFIQNGNYKLAIAPLVVGTFSIIISTARQSLAAQNDSRLGKIFSSKRPPRLVFPSIKLLNRQLTLPKQISESHLGWFSILIALLFMAFSLRQFGLEPGGNMAWAWYSYGIAIIVLIAALFAVDSKWSKLWSTLHRFNGIHINLHIIAYCAILLGILILGAGLRLHNLDGLPAGLWFDEADNLYHAREFAKNPGNTKVFVPSTNLPSMFLMPIALVVKLTGVSISAGRLVSVGFGLLGVVAVFLYVRFTLGTWTGLIAALLVSVMRWDINWSRIGMHGITAPFFAALTAYLTIRAVKTGKISDFGLAGTSLGLSMWFYTPLRIFPLILGFILVHHFIYERPEIRSFSRHVAVMIATTLIVAAPVVQVAITDSDLFFSRTKNTSIFATTPSEQLIPQIKNSFIKHLKMFHEKGDANPRHNLPGAPMLDYFSGILLLLGIGIAFSRWKETSLVTLPVWGFIMILPGVLTVPWEAPQSLRTITVIPAVAAMCALGISVIWINGRNAPWAWVRRCMLPLVLALLAAIAYINVDTYFGRQAQDPNVFASFSTDETLIAQHMIEQQSRGYNLWVSRQFLFSLTTKLLANDPRVEVVESPSTLPFDSSLVTQGVSIYLEPRESGVYQTLRVYYPDAEFTEFTPPGSRSPLFYSVIISASQLKARQGLQVTFIGSSKLNKDSVEIAVQSVWHSNQGPSTFPYQVSLDGSLQIRQPGEYIFELDSNVDATIELDGREILNSGRKRVKLVPAVGLHTISLRGTIRDTNQFIRLLWLPPGEQLKPITVGNLYHGSVRSFGLAGRFFKGKEIEPKPDAMHITPGMDNFFYNTVLKRPYIGVWDGDLYIARRGVYKFKAEASGQLDLYIEGRLVCHQSSPVDTSTTGEILLNPGIASVKLDYITSSPSPQFSILWARPNQAFESIPQTNFIPSNKNMFFLSE